MPRAAALESNHLKDAETNNEKIDDVAQEPEQEAEATQNDAEDAEKVHIRMPMELDLSDLAGALLLNHQSQ